MTATEQPVPALEEDLGTALGTLLRTYHQLLTSVLDDLPHGPRGYHTLAEVIRGQQPSQLALATHLGIDRTVMTYLVDDLVAAGLVERQPNPADRRQRRIVATAAGERTFAALRRRVGEAEDVLLGALTGEERTVLRRLLQRSACGVRDLAREVDPCAVVQELLDRDG